MTESELTAIIHEAFSLKAKIDQDKAHLKELNDLIIEHACANGVIPPTKCSGSITSDGGVAVKITKKDAYKWDQDKLGVARAKMGDERFMNVFTYKWEPLAKRTVDAFLAHAPVAERELVNAALTINTSYSVSYEKKDAADAV